MEEIRSKYCKAYLKSNPAHNARNYSRDCFTLKPVPELTRYVIPTTVYLRSSVLTQGICDRNVGLTLNLSIHIDTIFNQKTDVR